jgi:hypothetical protein
LFCSADFQVCCIAGFPTRRAFEDKNAFENTAPADWGIGDTADWKPALPKRPFNLAKMPDLLDILSTFGKNALLIYVSR